MDEKEPAEKIETLADTPMERDGLSSSGYKGPQRQTEDFAEMPGGHISIRRHSHSGQGYAGDTRRGMQGNIGKGKDYVPEGWAKGSYNMTDPSDYMRLKYLTDQEAIGISEGGVDGTKPESSITPTPQTKNQPRVLYSTDDEDHRHRYPETGYHIRREDYSDGPEPTMSEAQAIRLKKEADRIRYFGRN